MIRSIKVSNIGMLVDFDNLGSEFNSRKCVVHGLNGSGKSQLCALLRRTSRLRLDPGSEDATESLLEFARERLSKEATTTLAGLVLDDTTISIQTDTGEVGVTGNLQHIHVFNEEYLSANIGATVHLPERSIRIGETNKERDKLEVALKKIKQALVEVDKKIDEMLQDARERTGFAKQKRTIEIICRGNYLAQINSASAHPTALEDLKELADPPDRITLEAHHFLPSASISSEVDILLKQPFLKPSLTYSVYQRYVHTHKTFYDEGAQIFREIKDMCPFCLTKKTDRDKAIAELLSYVESEYSTAETMLASVKKQIMKLGDAADTFVQRSNVENVQVRKAIDRLKLDKKLIDVISIRSRLQEIVAIVNEKLQNMESNRLPAGSSFVIMVDSCIKPLLDACEKKESLAREINESIDHLSGRRRQLGAEVVENTMHELWMRRSLRDRRTDLLLEKEEIEDKLRSIGEAPSNDRTVGFFNQIIRILGIRKYELSTDSHLMLRLQEDHDITNEGFRISTGERKFLGLSYFLAEVLSSVATCAGLSGVTMIIDDPVDSSDYDRFYSFLSVIEKLDEIIGTIYGRRDIEIGQMVVFTHNSLLFERLANTRSFSCFLMDVIDNQTGIREARKGAGLTTFSSYLKRICRFVKRMEPPRTIDLGNSIRRVLEIIASVENVENNKFRDLNGTSKLNALANHLSHESLERMLEPLPDSHEYLAAGLELIELVRQRIPFLYETIEKSYLGGKNIDEYRKMYEKKYLGVC